MSDRSRTMRIVRAAVVVAAGLACAAGWTASSGEKTPASPCGAAFSADGNTLAVCDAANAEVVLAGADGKIVARIPTAGEPAGVCWAAGTNRIYVAEFEAGSVAEIDPAARKVVRHLPAGAYPRAVAVAAKRNLLLTADFGAGSVSAVSLESGWLVKRIPAAAQPVAIAVSPDERVALAGGLIPPGAAGPAACAVIVPIDLEALTPGAAIALPAGSSSVRDIRIEPAGRWAYVSHVLGRTNLPTTQLDRGWVCTNAVTILDVPARARYATVLLDSPSQGAANPWGMAISPDGGTLWVALAGIHEVARVDLAVLHKALAARQASDTPPEDDLALLYRANAIRRLDAGGLGPRAIALSPDGKRLAVAAYFSGTVNVLEAARAVAVSRIDLQPGAPRTLSEVRRGELLFSDARQCFQNWLSCASCHPDARADGLNWDLLNDGIGNPKNTRSMLLAHRTPPAMSTGIRETAESAVRSGLRHIQFTQPREADAAAIDAYLRNLRALPSPQRIAGRLSPAARRGEEVFRREKTGCARCHAGELFTDGKPYDVGTRSEGDRSGDYDTPTLIELWRTAPYLHDGSAPTLKDVVTTSNPKDRHGRTSHLSEAELADLVEYLRSL